MMETGPKLSFECSHCDYKGLSNRALREHFYRNHYKMGLRQSFKRKVAQDRSTWDKKYYETKTKEDFKNKLNHDECKVQANNDPFKYEYEIENEHETENAKK